MFNTKDTKRSNLKKMITIIVSLLVFSCALQMALAGGGGWTENFSSNPTTRGWSYSGVTPPLMSWNSTAGNLQCTWNSNTSTSRYGRGADLGFTLDQNHSFNLQFDMTFSYFSIGTTGYPYPITIGLYNSASTGDSKDNPPYAPDFIEWEYYLGNLDSPSYMGISVNDANADYSTCSAYSFLEPYGYTLQTSTTYHVSLNYDAGSQNMTFSMTANGNSYFSSTTLNLCGVQYSVDQFAVTSWYDDGGSYASPFIATGTVDNVQLSYPESVEPGIWMRLE